MKCTDSELMISKLLDSEVQPEDSQGLFAHLASCPDCRRTFRKMQELSSALGQLDETAEAPPVFPLPWIPARGFWHQRISVRASALALAALLAAMAIFFSFIRTGSQETIYVTKLSPIVVTGDTSSTQQQY